MDKLIILVRHGHYEFGSRDLSERGTIQIMGLCDQLQKIITKNTVLYCGNDKLCTQSTEIIEKYLGIETQRTELLNCSEGDYPDCENIEKLIENTQAHIVLGVSHLAQVGLFPSYLGNKLNSSESFECPSLGGAILLRIKKGKIKSLILPREIKKLKTFIKNLPSMPG